MPRHESVRAFIYMDVMYPKGAMDLHMDVHVRATQGAVACGGSDLCSNLKARRLKRFNLYPKTQ